MSRKIAALGLGLSDDGITLFKEGVPIGKSLELERAKKENEHQHPIRK